MKFIKDIIGEQRTRVRPAAASDDLPLRLETQDRVDDADPDAPIPPGTAAAPQLEAVTDLLNSERTQQQAGNAAPPPPYSEERLADDSEFDRILTRTRQEEAALRATTAAGVEAAEDTVHPKPLAPDNTAPTPGPERNTPAPPPPARAPSPTPAPADEDPRDYRLFTRRRPAQMSERPPEPEAAPTPTARSAEATETQTPEPEQSPEPEQTPGMGAPAQAPQARTLHASDADGDLTAPDLAPDALDAFRSDHARSAAPRQPDTTDLCPPPQNASAEEWDALPPPLGDREAVQSPVDVPAPAMGRGARRAGGRVKTRLLGFNPAAAPDPFASEADSQPPGYSEYPVGWLAVVRGPGRGATFTLYAGVSTIGRGSDQSVQLDFGDTSISRTQHAALAYDPEQRSFYVGHGGKANLVRLNNRPVLSTEPLNAGDTLRIGETELRFIPLCDQGFSWDDDTSEGDRRHAAAR
jgi:hypothetical protein